MVVRCAHRAVAAGPGNGSRGRAAARASGARELRSSARRRRGREPRQAVLQRRRRRGRRGDEALALPRRPGGRAAAVLAPSSLCSSLHARRLVAPAREPRERPGTRGPPSSPRKGRPSASSPLRGSGRRPVALLYEAMTSPRRSSRATSGSATARTPVADATPLRRSSSGGRAPYRAVLIRTMSPGDWETVIIPSARVVST